MGKEKDKERKLNATREPGSAGPPLPPIPLVVPSVPPSPPPSIPSTSQSSVFIPPYASEKKLDISSEFDVSMDEGQKEYTLVDALGSNKTSRR